METQPITRRVLRHPALSILAALLVIGGIGALADTLVGPSSAGDPLCAKAGRPPKGQQQQDASLEYRRLWQGAAPLFGSAGQPPPRLRFVGPDAPRPTNAAMWTGPDASNCRAIFIPPGARRLLAQSDGTLRARRHHRAAQRWALHETAHCYQWDAVLSNASLAEHGATDWEKAHSPALIGTRKKTFPPPFNQWRDRDQFGSNYGGNPQTFVWPTGAVPLGPR